MRSGACDVAVGSRFATGDGFEAERQWDQLRRLACRYGQGFHFARPLAGAAIDDLLADSTQPLAPIRSIAGR